MTTQNIVGGLSLVGGAYLWATSIGTNALSYQLMISGIAGLTAKAPGTMEGPKLGDLKIQTSNYGSSIPIAYGTIRTAGNVIWSAPIVETMTQTSSSGKGDDSVKTNNYSYSQSFAVALCEGEIIGVSKIWANGELIYNVSVDATSGTVSASNGMAITVYTGSETQTANSLIQSYQGIETPAYRGTAYIVFTNLQLASFGNRTPNLEFEVISSGNYSTLTNLTGSISTGSFSFPHSIAVKGAYAYVVNNNLHTLQVYNISDITSPLLISTSSTVASYPEDIAIEGSYAYVIMLGGALRIYNISNPEAISFVGSTVVGSGAYSVAVSRSGAIAYAYITSYATNSLTIVDVSFPETPVVNGSVSTGASPRSVAISGLYAYVVCLGSSTLEIFYVENSSVPVLAGSIATAGSPMDVFVSGSYAYVVSTGVLQIFDVSNPASPSLIGSAVAGVGTRSVYVSGSHAHVVNSVSNTIQVFNVSNPSAPFLTGSASAGTTPFALVVSGIYAYVVNEASYTLQIFDVSTRLLSTPVTVSSIVSDICLSSDLTAGDIDVTQLTDTIEGYVIASQNSARTSIEPLMSAFFFDGIESDGKVEFIKRGTSSGITIVEDELAAHEYNSQPADSLIMDRKQEIELPQEVAVKYMDKDASYKIGSQYSRRLTGSSINKQSIEMPMSISATKAKQIADVLIFDAWQGRVAYRFQTASKYSYIEPTDVIQVVKGGVSHTVRIASKDDQAGIYTFDGVDEDLSIYSQNSVAVTLPSENTIVENIALTNLKILDIPLLRDQDDGAGFYSAAAGLNGSWGGCIIYKSLDNGASYSQFGNPILNKMFYGHTTTTLGDFTQNIFDEKNTVTVYMENGTLSSVAEINVLNGENAALIGNEIIQFKTATLTATNTYVLSGLLRGRQGTEWAISTHTLSEVFVFLSTSNIVLQPAASSEFNITRKYAGASFGAYLDDAIKQDFTFQAVAQECYSPCQLGGGRNAANDLTLKWVRRTRIRGGWNDYGDVPLGEDAELYEVEIYSSPTYATLLRTITGLTIAATTYSAALQTLDGLTPGSPVSWKVFQVSTTNGRGYEARGIT